MVAVIEGLQGRAAFTDLAVRPGRWGPALAAFIIRQGLLSGEGYKLERLHVSAF